MNFGCFCCVENINKLVDLKLRIKSDAQHTTLARTINVELNKRHQ